MSNDTNIPFNIEEAKSMCSKLGLFIGVFWSLSFLCAMSGAQNILLSQLSNLLGIASIFFAGMSLRSYSRKICHLNFMRSWWMALLSYGCAILITALTQLLYFKYIDNGQLYSTMVALLQNKEYIQMLEQLSPDGNAQPMIDSINDVMLSPTKITIQLLWMNVILAIIVSIPTAIYGSLGTKK